MHAGRSATCSRERKWGPVSPPAPTRAEPRSGPAALFGLRPFLDSGVAAFHLRERANPHQFRSFSGPSWNDPSRARPKARLRFECSSGAHPIGPRSRPEEHEPSPVGGFRSCRLFAFPLGERPSRPQLQAVTPSRVAPSGKSDFGLWITRISGMKAPIGRFARSSLSPFTACLAKRCDRPEHWSSMIGRRTFDRHVPRGHSCSATCGASVV